MAIAVSAKQKGGAGQPASYPQKRGRRRSWRVRLEGWTCLLLFAWSLVASVSSHANLMVLFASLIAGVLVVGTVLPLTVPRHVVVRAEVPEYLFAGQTGWVRLTVRSRRLVRPLPGVTVRVRLDPPVVGPVQHFVDGLRAGEERSFSEPVVIRNRGEYVWQPPEVASTYPFGFLEYARTANEGAPRRLVVYPAIGQWNMELFEQQLGSRVSQQLNLPDVAAREQEFRGLRDYREGDSARWIHWPTSARRGELVVREFEVPRDRRILIVLIPWVPGEPSGEDLARLEVALSLTATMIYELARRPATRLGVVLATETPATYGIGAGEGAPGPALEALALAQGARSPDFDATESALRRWSGPGVLATVVTTASPQQLERHSGKPAQRFFAAIRGLLIDVSDRANTLAYYVPPPWLLDTGITSHAIATR